MKNKTNNSSHAYNKYWDVIDKSLNEGSDSGYKIAIIETEKILNLAFNEKGIPGKDILDKIDNVKGFIKNPEKLHYSHTMYKRIIEEPGFRISAEDTKEIVLGYYKSINEISNIESKDIPVSQKLRFFYQNHFTKYFFNPKKIIIYIFLFFFLIFISTETTVGLSISEYLVGFTHYLFYTLIFNFLKIVLILAIILGIIYYIQGKLKNK